MESHHAFEFTATCVSVPTFGRPTTLTPYPFWSRHCRPARARLGQAIMKSCQNLSNRLTFFYTEFRTTRRPYWDSFLAVILFFGAQLLISFLRHATTKINFP